MPISFSSWPLKTILSLRWNHAAFWGFSLWHLPHAKKAGEGPVFMPFRPSKSPGLNRSAVAS